MAHGDAGTLILVGASQEHAQPLIETINDKFHKVKVLFITADSGQLATVRGAAETIQRLDIPIDGIVACPALMAGPWETTADGIESHFQVNYLAHFLLVNLLLASMSEGATAVLVSTSIGPEARAPRYDDIGFSVSQCIKDPFRALKVQLIQLGSAADSVGWRIIHIIMQDGRIYDPLDAYAQSMFANIQFPKCLANACAGRSLTAFSVNPGSELMAAFPFPSLSLPPLRLLQWES